MRVTSLISGSTGPNGAAAQVFFVELVVPARLAAGERTMLVSADRTLLGWPCSLCLPPSSELVSGSKSRPRGPSAPRALAMQSRLSVRAEGVAPATQGGRADGSNTAPARLPWSCAEARHAAESGMQSPRTMTQVHRNTALAAGVELRQRPSSASAAVRARALHGWGHLARPSLNG
eukprot:365347-Chlamydomonas_euryale.AAC.12